MIALKCEECGAIYEGEFKESRIRDDSWFDCQLCGERLLEGPWVVYFEARLIVTPESKAPTDYVN
ncbi:MAG TPA: hypothetical protein VFD58_09225 [Blastocatellia bacterium]|nr:hypothetical protein [Blastocatellia bacterium]